MSAMMIPAESPVPVPAPEEDKPAAQESCVEAKPAAPPAKIPGFDEPTLRRFLSYIVDPAIGCTELCVLSGKRDRSGAILPNSDFKTPMSGWYTDVDRLVESAKQLRRASAYVCLNPADHGMLGVSDHVLKRADGRTKDEHIKVLRWFYIDVDHVGIRGASASEDELARTVALRDRILADHPAIRRASLVGRSGNGAFAMARLPDYPNDADHKKLIADSIASLIARYSADGSARIDDKTKNPARLGCLPGTLKCKGSHITSRPWRLATLDGEPEGGDPANVPTLDLRAWLAENPSPVVHAPARSAVPAYPVHSMPPWQDAAHVEERARKCVFAMRDAVEHEGGHAQLYAVAVALVDGFGLDRGAAHRIFGEWNAAKARPPESDRQVEHKLDDAFKNYPVPSLKLLNAERPGWRDDGRPATHQGGVPATLPPSVAAIASVEPPATPPAVVPDPDQPAGPTGRRPLLVEPIKARAAHHATNNKIEDLYRDDEFMRDLARLERENVGEAEAIKWQVGRITDFKVKAFNAVLGEARKATKGGKAGGVEGEGNTALDGIPQELPPFRPTDLGNSALFAYHHGKDVKFYAGGWLFFDGTRWAEDKSQRVVSLAKTLSANLGEYIDDDTDDETAEAVQNWQLASESRRRIFDALALAQSIPGIAADPSEFNRDDYALNVLNGTVDLRTGEFREHRREDLITRMAPVKYDPQAKCPNWAAHVAMVTNDSTELAGYIQRALGYGCTGSIGEHCLFFLHGGGRNGKGVTVNTVKRLLGDYAISVNPALLTTEGLNDHPTGLADLEGARLVIVDEPEDTRQVAEGLIKRLTGGTPIRARRMGKDFYEFDPKFTIYLISNPDIEIHGTDNGIWSRFRKIPFTQEIPEGNRIKDYDKHLFETEGSGILNWLIAGCKDWIARNGLAEPDEVKSATSKLRVEQDLVQTFIDEHCMVAPTLKDGSSRLYEAYKIHCRGNGLKPIASPKFYEVLTRKGFVADRTKAGRFRLGLALGKVEVARWLAALLESGQRRVGDVLSQGEINGIDKQDIFLVARPPIVMTNEILDVKFWSLGELPRHLKEEVEIGWNTGDQAPESESIPEPAFAIADVYASQEEDDYTRRGW